MRKNLIGNCKSRISCMVGSDSLPLSLYTLNEHRTNRSVPLLFNNLNKNNFIKC